MNVSEGLIHRYMCLLFSKENRPLLTREQKYEHTYKDTLIHTLTHTRIPIKLQCMLHF